jgi:hypothetical protein
VHWRADKAIAKEVSYPQIPAYLLALREHRELQQRLKQDLTDPYAQDYRPATYLCA